MSTLTTAVLSASMNTPPRLTYSSGDSAYKADLYSLDFEGNTYDQTFFAFSLAPSVIVSVLANETLIKQGTTPVALDIGLDDVDIILAIDPAGSPDYKAIACSSSRTASLTAELIGGGHTISATITQAWKFVSSTQDYDWTIPNKVWVVFVRAIAETAFDSGDGLTFNLLGKDAQIAPTTLPKVYVDGELQAGGFAFNKGDADTAASVTFVLSKAGSLIVVDYRYRWELTPDESGSQFEVSDGINGRSEVDVNGNRSIEFAYNINAGMVVGLKFVYQNSAFYNRWRDIWINGWGFDIQRPNLEGDMALIQNLYVATKPGTFSEIPSAGGGGLSHTAFVAEQIL